MSVLDLDREKWKQFKTDNNLSKSSFFKKADVGPTIDKFQTAVERFRDSKSQKDLMSVFSKAEELQKAFAKFIQLKEAKDELSDAAKTKIKKWSGQLDNVNTALAKLSMSSGSSSRITFSRSQTALSVSSTPARGSAVPILRLTTQRC